MGSHVSDMRGQMFIYPEYDYGFSQRKTGETKPTCMDIFHPVPKWSFMKQRKIGARNITRLKIGLPFFNAFLPERVIPELPFG
jgi:hypothetical protein